MSGAARDAAGDLVDLVSAQIRLARVEVSSEVAQGARRVGRIALFVPPLVGGYAFAIAALASWLGTYWQRPVALAAVAALQLAVAGLGLRVVLAKTRPSDV